MRTDRLTAASSLVNLGHVKAVNNEVHGHAADHHRLVIYRWGSAPVVGVMERQNSRGRFASASPHRTVPIENPLRHVIQLEV